MVRIQNLAELEQFLGITLVRYYSKDFDGNQGNALSAFGTNLASMVKARDLGAIEDACQLIDADPHLPFGKLIKSELARALKQASGSISSSNCNILITRIAAILSLDFCPREAEDYCKLMRKLDRDSVAQLVQTASPKCEKSKVLIARMSDNDV